jgi:Na+/H+ antiporter NhaC
VPIEGGHLTEGNPKALAPIVVFVALYLGLGMILEYGMGVDMGFYDIPVLFVFLIALAIAYLQTRKADSQERFSIMARGVGDPNVFTMILIFLCAGVFTGVMNRAGAESVANFVLTFIPIEYAVVVLFAVSAFVSLSMGTSCGTITVLTPIAVSLAAVADFNMALCVATVIGGAMFGDNLSFISDTTIATCNGQGCDMRDKFRENSKIAFPAAIITAILIAFISVSSTGSPGEVGDYNLVLIIPYLIVLIGGIVGINVFVVLAGGIASGIIVMVFTGTMEPVDILPMIGSGMSGMLETAMVAIMVSAICALIAYNGGFVALLSWIKKVFKGRRGGMLGMGFLVSAMDVATANNTVAIVMANPIAKTMSEDYGISPRRTASLLDTFSCIMQGIIPYGAQMLLALSIVTTMGFSMSAFDVIPFLIYQFVLLGCVLVFIFFVPRKETGE